MSRQIRLTPQEFCDKQWDNVQTFIEGVEDGSIISGQSIKLAVKRYRDFLNNPKFVYNTKKVDKVFKFFSFLKVISDNVYYQIDLMPWQAFILSFIYGFYYADDPTKRVIREILLMIARKNGKTCFSAGIQLFGLLGDGVQNPQSILLANTASQAAISLEFEKSMIVRSPELRRRLIGQRNRVIFRDKTKQGFSQVFSSIKTERLDGLNPSSAILDEVHGYDDNSTLQVIKTGVGTRENPLIFLITTAGNKNNGFLNEYLAYHKAILNGNIDDENSIGFIFQPDPHDDLHDEEVWAKANPSIGKLVKYENLRITYNQAQFSLADQHDFVTKHLNLFWDNPKVWIPEDSLKPLFKPMNLDDFAGRECWAGLDLSRNTDLSALTLLFPPIDDDPKFYFYTLFFMANRPSNILRRGGKDLTEWLLKQYIIKCDKEVIDLDLIYEKVTMLNNQFTIVNINYDRYNAPQLMAKLQQDGITCTPFDQTAMRFNSSLKTMESLVYMNEAVFDDNPAMLWMFSNVILYVDSNSNIKIIKTKQNDSVDGVVSAAMALGGFIDSTYGKEVMLLRSYMNAIADQA